MHLTINIPGAPERTFEIRHGVYTVGSDKGNKIVLPGKRVAWRHAVLSILEDAIWVENLSGDEGTFVDGQPVEGRARLEPGQQLGVGGCTLAITPGTPSTPAPALPPEPSPQPVPVMASAGGEPLERKDVQAKHLIKTQIQEELLERLDIKRLTHSHIGEEDLRKRVRRTVHQIVRDVRQRLPAGIDPAGLEKEVYDEAVGLGPLEDLLDDNEITEIMVNGHNQIFIEKQGRLYLTDKTFLNNDSVLAIIERIVAPIGRRIDESQPYVDARLPDGSRVNAIIPPLSLTGPSVTIRKFSKEAFTIQDMVRLGTLTDPIAGFLAACVRLRKNIVVSGGTGSGKTTFLNVLSSYLPETERIITIEDAAELRLTQEHVVRLEARPPNIEGRGRVTIRDLVRNALRMRPDRVVVGECRGGEALDMLQAMNTGHEGSLTTVHANSPRDVISRLETMVLMSGMEIPLRAIREQIGAAIHMVAHTARYPDGTRKLARVTEIVGLEGDQITMQDIFSYKQTGTSADGLVDGVFVPTGAVPTFLEELAVRGLSIDHAIFDPKHAPAG